MSASPLVRLPGDRLLAAAVRLADTAELLDFCERHRRLFVLTGAGCSTASGIPDYRSPEGLWKGRHRPMLFQDFTASAAMRQRYWARSVRGWSRVAAARPNPAHQALARLEADGRISALATQNVDGLHGRAGSRRLIELHGSLARVSCLDCGDSVPRPEYQRQLERMNPIAMPVPGAARPDGDMQLDEAGIRDFRVPGCPRCGGRMKPDVVFFGESVPGARVKAADEALRAADAVLVVGSSLAVMSGYRFVRTARRRGMPVAAINLGATRADGELAFRVALPCEKALPQLAGARSLHPARSRHQPDPGH